MRAQARRGAGRSLAGAVALAMACAQGCGDAVPERGPDVVLITVDTLRPDHLPIYGHTYDTAPRLSGFAETALVFDDCHASAPSTRLSLGTLLTGFYPHETGVLGDAGLSPEVDTLAEVFRDAGYTTLAVIGNYVLPAKDGWAQGFDVYDHEMSARELNRRAPERLAPDTTDRALALLDTHPDRPVFLWVHYQDPHGPYTPPAPFADRFARSATRAEPLQLNASLSGTGGIPYHQRLGDERDLHHYVARYDGEIAYLDQHLGRLLDGLAARGLGDEAIIAFTADHGEAMGERGFYFSHIGFLHGNLTRVPMLLKRGEAWTGRRPDACQHADLVPTLLAAVGVPRDPRLRGRDLLDPESRPAAIFAATDSPIDRDGTKFSLIEEGFKLIVNVDTGSSELYDLRRDPGESEDLSGEAAHATRLRRLATRLQQIRDDNRLGIEPGRRKAPLDADERERLEALGYVR